MINSSSILSFAKEIINICTFHGRNCHDWAVTYTWTEAVGGLQWNYNICLFDRLTNM